MFGQWLLSKRDIIPADGMKWLTEPQSYLMPPESFWTPLQKVMACQETVLLLPLQDSEVQISLYLLIGKKII
jgi:hypothetical protein